MLPRLLVTAIFILACGGPAVSRLPTLTPTGAPAPTVAPAQAVRSGEASKDLGVRSVSFGSTAQAAELLQLINDQPSKTDYQITYETDADTVLFACNFEKGVIVRIHQQPDGHGSQESWQGYILERLRAAAGGGSLNDTPEGKIPVVRQDF